MECLKEDNSARYESGLKKTDEVIIIEDDTKPVHKKNKNKKYKRKVKLNTLNNNRESLVITQKVELKKQKIECIINLTNVNEHEHKKKRKGLKYSSCRKPKRLKVPRLSTDRIVPQCLRRQCSLAILAKCCVKRKEEQKKADSIGNLSPVSSVVLEDSCPSDLSLSYEDISSGSLSDISEAGTNELNTLIMRTKERERKLSQTSDKDLGTSVHGEVTETVTEEMDDSLHSISTLVLEPLSENIYSPTHPTMSPERSTMYSSPTTPEKLIIDEDRLYSPTRSLSNFTEDTHYLEEVSVPFDKKEFAPIEFNNNNILSEEANINSVKNEVYSPFSFENLFGSKQFPINNNKYSQDDLYSSSQTTVKTERKLTESQNRISPEPKNQTKVIKTKNTQNCLLNSYKYQRLEKPKSELIASNFQSDVSSNNHCQYIKVENSCEELCKKHSGYNNNNNVNSDLSGIQSFTNNLDHNTAIKSEL